MEKIKDFMESFKERMINEIKNSNLSEEEEIEKLKSLNGICDREFEDRELTLEDFDVVDGYLFNLMCDYFDSELGDKKINFDNIKFDI